MATFTMSVTRPDLFRQVPSNGRSLWYPSVVKTENGVAMSGYSHLSRWERDQIAELKAAGRSVGAIAQAQGK
jgi:hypothetical protein